MVSMPVFNGNSESYLAQLTIYGNQKSQDAENQKIHDAYVDACNNYIVQYTSQLAAKQPLPTPPTLPHKKIYNDDGTVNLAPFPDLTQVVPPIPQELPGGGGIKNLNPPMDRTDGQTFLLQEVLTAVNALSDALKKKGVI